MTKIPSFAKEYMGKCIERPQKSRIYGNAANQILFPLGNDIAR
jgi:hypothetical protein